MTHYHRTDSGILIPFAPHVLKRSSVEGEVTARLAMEGLYKLVVRKNGMVKQETPWFENLILDAGLNRLGSGGGGGVCEIGTGTAAPAVSQTSLQSFVARKVGADTTTFAAQPSSPYFYTQTQKYSFAVGALNGNYTEVGVGWANSTLFSRALITPDGVNPTAITVNADEQLDVFYTCRIYPPSETDWGAGTFNITGSGSHDVIGRLSSAATNSSFASSGPLTAILSPLRQNNFGMAAYTGVVGAITGVPSGTNLGGISFNPSLATYTNNSYSRQSTLVYPLANANGSIRSILLSPEGLMYDSQYQFTPAIVKDSTKTLSLTFSCSWARRP
jgi:hypothetical protein